MTDKNISLFKAEKKVLNLTITDDDGKAIDLTDPDVDSVNFHVSTGLAKYGETKFEKTGSGLTENGDSTFTIESSDTESLTPGNYLYEVYIEFNQSSNYTAEVAKLFVKPRVDR